MTKNKWLLVVIFSISILLFVSQVLLFSNKQAARKGDKTAHAGTINQGCPTVLIGGKPAARLGDYHTCPMILPTPQPIPHVGGTIFSGSQTVLIGGKPAARLGDQATCQNGPPDTIIIGCPTVLIGD